MHPLEVTHCLFGVGRTSFFMQALGIMTPLFVCCFAPRRRHSAALAQHPHAMVLHNWPQHVAMVFPVRDVSTTRTPIAHRIAKQLVLRLGGVAVTATKTSHRAHSTTALIPFTPNGIVFTRRAFFARPCGCTRM